MALQIAILGVVEPRVDGVVVGVPPGKQRALLALLALKAPYPVSAESAADALWPRAAPAEAMRRLQVTVSRLRRSLGAVGSAVETVPSGYRLAVEPDAIDARRFKTLIGSARATRLEGDGATARRLLDDALELWRGPALVEFAYEPFAQGEIARLEELRLAAVEELVDVRLSAGEHLLIVAELEQLVSEHPSRERLVSLLMLALYRSGRQSDALEVYTRSRRRLDAELGLAPSSELRRLEEAILRHDPSLDTPVGGPHTRDRDAPSVVCTASRQAAARLPTPATALFGREGDLEHLERLMQESSARLVTLAGPGGVGKTRLAIEACRRHTQRFADGVCFVELASESEPGQLASALSRALGLPAIGDERPETTLLRVLGDFNRLLVLDTFEHLLAAAPLIVKLLDACPALTILVTSREPTRLAAERLHSVRPLGVPPATVESMVELEGHAAVAMFCDRARARDPDLVLDDSTAAYVRAICRRLDGVPLALELAVARIGLLSLRELAARLDQALGVLGGGPRDAPERQRTLRATIDWSYDLLTNDERRAFGHIAVFAGGATITAAEAVTGASLDTLDSLVAKQLLVRRGERLHLLDTVREYALERLAEDPAADEIQHRLATSCLAFVREATPHLVQADRHRWLASLDAELPNALSALSWALERHRSELALQLATELATYWWRTSRLSDGLARIEPVLSEAQDASPGTRATALLSCARLTGVRDHRRHRQHLQGALDLFKKCDDPAGVGMCLSLLAIGEAFLGNYDVATCLSDEAIGLAENARDEGAIALVHADSALVAANYADASRRAARAVSLLQGVGNLRDLALVCSVTGYFAIAERRYEAALGWLDEGLQAAYRLDDARGICEIRGNQGLANLFLEELDDAAHAFREALIHYRSFDPDHLVDEPLLGLAAVAALRGQYVRAAQVVGTVREHVDFRHPKEEAIWRRVQEEILMPCKARYGPDKWMRAEQQAAVLTLPEAIRLAIDVTESHATASR